MQQFISLTTEALDTVTGGGSGACDAPPEAYSTPQQGAELIRRAVKTDLHGKEPTPAQMKGAVKSFQLGRDFNVLCDRIRWERSGGKYVP